ncbi:hypothetical protein AB0M39_07400 [Streptomyces sp. NPDC051907]|uniref:hypothetical protein n=1 Tax=Streptomyces sp. NPDC051907 TaxID=3155284 RepID=UPI003416F6FB
MWHGCTPVLGAELDSPRREISGWQIPGIGELDIESEGYRMSVLPSESTLRVELAFAGAYVESATEPYRSLGPVLLSMEGVLSLSLDTPGAPDGPLWKRVLRADSSNDVLRMAWDEKSDILYVRDGGLTLVCRGGAWRWQVSA